MNKIISGMGVGIIALALPLVSFAATITNPTSVFNGQAQVYGNAGQSEQVNFQVSVPAGQVLHAIRTKVDGQATVCTEVGPFEGAQTVGITTSITLPPNTNNGGYSLIGDLFYTDTLPQAQAMTGNLACTDNVTGSHSNLGAYNQPTPVNVLPSSGSSSSTGTGSVAPDWMAAFMAQITALLHPVVPPAPPAPPAPVVSTACTQLNSYLSMASPNMRSDANIALQGFLLSQHMSIPALAAGASFGFDGPQTQAAVYTFKSANSCQ